MSLSSSFFTLVALGLLASFVSSGVSGSYRIKPNGFDYVKEGGSAYLKCTPRQRNITCLWARNGTPLIDKKPKYQYDNRAMNGDCSLLLEEASYPEDNAKFQCWIAGTGDLNSAPFVQVVVLVKPNAPLINLEGIDERTAIAGSPKLFNCNSKGGNPQPQLHWFLGNKNITFYATYSSKADESHSVLNYTFAKSDNGSTLECKSVHPLQVNATRFPVLVNYKPKVKINISDSNNFAVTDGGSVYIMCSVDEANPPASVRWSTSFKQSSLYQIRGSGNSSMLIVNKITSAFNGAVFECSATNIAGNSIPVSVKFDVLFNPRVEENSQSEMLVEYGKPAQLYCRWKGNPKPVIRWSFTSDIDRRQHQLPPHSLERPEELFFENVTYKQAGIYFCSASNYNRLTGLHFSSNSPSTKLTVFGQPQFVEPERTVTGSIGFDTIIELAFCSNPLPTRVYWEFKQQLKEVNLAEEKNQPPGTPPSTEDVSNEPQVGRLTNPDPRNDNPTCFTAPLLVRNTDALDAAEYRLTVVNKYGSATGVVVLKTTTFMTGAFVVTLGTIILFTALFVVVMCVFLLRRRSTSTAREHLAPHDFDKGEVGVPMTVDDTDEKVAKKSLA